MSEVCVIEVEIAGGSREGGGETNFRDPIKATDRECTRYSVPGIVYQVHTRYCIV